MMTVSNWQALSNWTGDFVLTVGWLFVVWAIYRLIKDRKDTDDGS